MCDKPITDEFGTRACRACDSCIANRRHQWEARAMAEATEWPYVFVVALTYDESTQRNRDAARFFSYVDVREFNKRLLRAANYRKPGATVRFIVCGEQGSRYDRVHWHLIIYSDVDVRALGKVTRFGKEISDPEEMMSPWGNKKRMKRLHWSIWGRGFVTFQPFDQGGASYVLSYVLKDQFTVEKSKGTMRETKAEAFATGLFRPSKFPPIGWKWLVREMEALHHKGQVLPQLQMKVPGFRGHWIPSGSWRKHWLWFLRAIRDYRVFRGEGEPPQWSSLLASVSAFPPDLEILQDGEESEETSVEREIDLRQRERAGAIERRAAILRRPYTLRCVVCLNSVADSDLLGTGWGRYIGRQGRWVYYDAETGQDAGRASAVEALRHIDCTCEGCGSRHLVLAIPRRCDHTKGSGHLQAAS